jgi:hypothetical protein
MPNRKAKEAKKAAKREAARERDKAARREELEKERTRLRAQAVESDLAGEPSIASALPRMSVRERKLQRENKGVHSLSGELKGRVVSKHEILAGGKNVVIREKNV